jgi:hypothetical protein
VDRKEEAPGAITTEAFHRMAIAALNEVSETHPKLRSVSFLGVKEGLAIYSYNLKGSRASDAHPVSIPSTTATTEKLMDAIRASMARRKR